MSVETAIVVLLLILLIFAAGRQLLNWAGRENLQSNLAYYDFRGSENPTEPFICLIAGTHGNEPAGSVALEHLALTLKHVQFARGHIRIIPRINVWGLNNNFRYKSWLSFLPDADINRNYTSTRGTDAISREVLDLTRGANLVIDFHEGWGYHSCQPASVGSTASPTTFEPAPTIARQITQAINTKAPNTGQPECRFMTLPDASCDINTTLACHMQKNSRPYILIETTGQNDIQLMSTREGQVHTAALIALKHFGIIPAMSKTQ